MRRRTLLVVLVVLAVLVAAGVVVLWPREDRITREKFDRICEGMSRAEVEAILGPPGDYSSGPLQYARTSLYAFFSSGPHPTDDFVLSSPLKIKMRDERTQVDRVEWRTDRQIATVYYLPSGRVRIMGFSDVARLDQSPFANLLWRAKRQWHRWFP